MDRPLLSIVNNADAHRSSAVGKTDFQLLRMLIEEVGELAEALDGSHEHPAELELTQIAGIALNWLRVRSNADQAPVLLSKNRDDAEIDHLTTFLHRALWALHQSDPEAAAKIEQDMIAWMKA